MENLTAAVSALKSVLPQLIPISSVSNQPGLYLIFSGSDKLAPQIDEAKFKILLQARSFNDDNFGAIAKLDELRRILAGAGESLGADCVGGINFEGFKDSLFVYSLDIKLKIYGSKK